MEKTKCLLHCHTEFSNLKLRDSIVKIESLAKKAIASGYCGVAITDHEILSGHVQAIKVGEEIRKTNPDFKMMLGNEIYLIDESEYKNTKKYYHFILIAKDKKGHEQLRRLSSRAWERSYMEKGVLRTPTFYRDFAEVIGDDSGHLISSSACLGSLLATSILNKDSEQLNKFISWMVQTFGKEDCFLEMQDSDSEEQKIVNNTIVRLSEHFGIDYILTSDVHYLNKEDITIHHAFLNSKEEDDRETEAFYKYTYVKTEEGIKQILNHLPSEVVTKALANTMKIYDKVENVDIRQKVTVPVRVGATVDERLLVFKNKYKEYFEKYPFLEIYRVSPCEHDRRLLCNLLDGLENKPWVVERHGLDTIFQRFNDEELNVIKALSDFHKQPMGGYFNTMQDFCDIVWNASLLGPGRGSASAFLTNYLLDITQVDPIMHNLPAFRFLNKARVDDFADIDIDIDPSKAKEIMENLKREFGADCVLNTATFKTEKLKSAILTAARGMGIPLEAAENLSALVPVDRGRIWDFKECLEGDEEKESKPVPNFEKMLREYEGFYETVESLCGLISGRSQHASSVYLLLEGYIARNSYIKAPDGTPMTAFNMYDSDSLGCLKYDLLKIDALTKMMKCMDLLLKDGLIKWKGSLKSTYTSFLHPDTIGLENQKVWDNICAAKVTNLFQFETQVGSVALHKIKPRSIRDLSLTNDVMRLQGTLNGISPSERLSSYKENINLWYDEMKTKGLTSEEISTLEPYLLPTYGCSINQETLMRLLLDPKIANFSLGQTNNARKVLAKKKIDQVEKVKADFYLNVGVARKEFLDYVWNYMVEPQMSYSFASSHSTAYGIIAYQEAYLYTVFNSLYWQCACLSVNAGSSETNFEDFGDEEDPEDVLEEYEKADSNDDEENKPKTTVTDYGKVAKAIGEIQAQGVKILLPDINKSQMDFIPNISQNAIMYGMQGITSVNVDMIANIIAGRPYVSLEDFISKNTMTNVQMINLIKAGAFDLVEKRTRQYTMDKYLRLNATSRTNKKAKLTMANYDKALAYDIIPKEFAQLKKLIAFERWVKKNCLVKGADNRKRYILTDADEVKFFSIVIMNNLSVGKDYDTVPNGFGVKASAFDKYYSTSIQPLKDWMLSESAIEIFAQAEIQQQIDERFNKYCEGSISKWEMASIGCYVAPHELAKVNSVKYGIKDFHLLPETATPTSFKKNKNTGVEYPVYSLCRVAGTVLNADKAKHIVTLLTVYGVVDIKFYKMAFIQYNRRISKMSPDGKKKTVIENSWFTRGNKLLVSGFRRENMFIPRADYGAGYKKTVQLIEDVKGGELILKTEREKE